MPSRDRHPKKDVEKALQDLEEDGFEVDVLHRGHRWGVVRCPGDGGDYCEAAVFCSPRNPSMHAVQLRRLAARCTHLAADSTTDAPLAPESTTHDV